MQVPMRILKVASTRRFWFGALLAAMGGAALYLLTAKAIESDAELRFRSVARIAAHTISSRIKSYTDVLRGAAGLLRADPDTTAEQFRHYVEQLDIQENFPGIEVINYAVHIDEQTRPGLESLLNRQLKSEDPSRPPLVIKSRGANGSYTVITYIEPQKGAWLDKLGMDLEAREYTRMALAKSRDFNSMTASGTRVPILSGPNRHGLAMRLPVYRSGMPSQTLEQRRAAYFGSVGIGFGVQSLISGVLETLPIKGTRLVVTDLTPVPAERGERPQPAVLFDSHFESRESVPRDTWLSREVLQFRVPIEFSQRTWLAEFSISRSSLYSGFDAIYPCLAAFAGAITTALLYALFQTMAASRRNAIRIAGEMTQELRSSQVELRASHEKLRRLAAHAEQIKERERKRIAREIHDDLGQSLLALRIDAEMLATRTSNAHSRLHSRARATLQQIDATIRSVRQIINDLRPNVLDLGLNAAVDWQISVFERRTGIKCCLIEHEAELRVDDQCATALFRILQESLNNIAQHARATDVQIELHMHDNMLSMAIHDNGIGLQPGSRNRPGSFGLVGIEERVAILGGTFSVKSEPGAGTVLLVKVIVANSQAPRTNSPPRAAPSVKLAI
jgi:signal transduction histidine kinase/CHASE1-domain containing sensor protein